MCAENLDYLSRDMVHYCIRHYLHWKSELSFLNDCIENSAEWIELFSAHSLLRQPQYFRWGEAIVEILMLGFS